MAGKHWNRLSRDVGSHPCSEVSRIQLENTWRNLIWSQTWPCSDQEVGQESSWGSFQPEWAEFIVLMLKSRTQLKQQISTINHLLQSSRRPRWPACALLLGTPRGAPGARDGPCCLLTPKIFFLTTEEYFDLATMSFLWKSS